MSPQDRQSPSPYDSDTIMVSGDLLLDQEEHMVREHDIDPDDAEDFFRDVKTQVMLLEQSIPKADWDNREIDAITNTILGFAHQQMMLEEIRQSTTWRDRWISRGITTLLLTSLTLGAFHLGNTGLDGTLTTLDIISGASIISVLFLFLLRE